MNDFGARISKTHSGYISTFWFLDENRIVTEKSKTFFSKSFALRWSRKQIINKISSQYIKEK